MKTKFFFIAFLLIVSTASYSQTDFSEYDDVCFCNSGLMHPRTILRFDNNQEILFSLENGKSLHELNQKGIKYTKSQFALLKLSHLIEKKDSVYYPAVPILSKENTLLLRNKSYEVAKNIVDIIDNDYKLFNTSLNKKGLKNNSFSLFFALTLDGLVWDVFRQNNDLTKSHQVTKEAPFWNGTFWILTPKRQFSCGTNSFHSGNFILCENWSNSAKVGVSNYKLFKKLLSDYANNGKITNPEVIKEFKQNGIFDAGGEIQVPVIKADSTDIIFSQTETIAKKVAEYIGENVDYSTVLSDYPYLTREQKIIILYHEVMWDILDIMEKRGVLQKPVAFANPDKSHPRDLKDVIFIIEE